MKRIIFVILILFVCFLFSCSAQESKTESELRACVNTSINSYLEGVYGESNIDFYSMMDKTEKLLIDNKVLENSTRKGYSKFFKNENLQEKKYQETFLKINHFLKENRFEGSGYFVKSYVLKDCPFKILSFQGDLEKSFLENQLRIISDMEANGVVKNQMMNNCLVEISDKEFSKSVYRAPFTLLLYLCLKEKYENR